MKNLPGILILALPALTLSSIVFAEGNSRTFAPVEIYSCNYNEGKSAGDLKKVVAKWNKFMDKNKSAPYSAWTLTREYGSSKYKFDVGWIGVWKDGNAMGAGTALWKKKGSKLNAAFFEVITCDSHANFASEEIKGGTAETASKNPVVQFSDCKIKKGHTMKEVRTAMKSWGDYQAKQGSKSSIWVWYPVYGEDTDYDFKWVEGHPDYEAFGADYERYGNGGGFMKAGELFREVVDCGVSRVYDGETVRIGWES